MMRDNQNQQFFNSVRSSIESKKKTTAQKQQESSVMGFCNLDLMPLLLGN